MSARNSHLTMRQTYTTRATLPGTHPLAHFLFHLMSTKRSNLCLSADVSSTAQLLQLAEEVGDSICMIKTHADIIDDFGERTVKGLRRLAAEKKFLVFEDRKFGDIGSTVQKQYSAGPFRTVEWACFINAHVFPGPDIITALKLSAHSFLKSSNHSVTTEISADERLNHDDGAGGAREIKRTGSIVSTTTIETRVESSSPRAETFDSRGMQEALEQLEWPPRERALLLLAEMSSQGNLLTPAYTEECVTLARDHKDFVLGFIAQRTLNTQRGDNFITFTPGVAFPPAESPSGSRMNGDGLGQQYNSPRRMVLEKGTDVIIVGRGIISAKDRKAEAEKYRREAWKAYEDRTGRTA